MNDPHGYPIYILSNQFKFFLKKHIHIHNTENNKHRFAKVQNVRHNFPLNLTLLKMEQDGHAVAYWNRNIMGVR